MKMHWCHSHICTMMETNSRKLLMLFLVAMPCGLAGGYQCFWEKTVSISPADGKNVFLPNGVYTRVHMVSQQRTTTLTSLTLKEPQIPKTKKLLIHIQEIDIWNQKNYIINIPLQNTLEQNISTKI